MLICDIYVIFIHKQTCLYGLIIYQIYFDILYTFLYLVCTNTVCTCTIFLSGVWLYRHLWPENQIWASSGPQVPAVFGLSVSQWVSECVRVSNSNAWCLPPVFISLQVSCWQVLCLRTCMCVTSAEARYRSVIHPSEMWRMQQLAVASLLLFPQVCLLAMWCFSCWMPQHAQSVPNHTHTGTRTLPLSSLLVHPVSGI